ncbi:MAG TPA: PilW family protein [Albitalea sp.]|nr:PilW family protein [Albitalea sp.]
MITTRPLRAPRPARRHARGLTLVELMVSLVIGLLIVIAMSALFVGSTRSRREVELSADVIESGRYAVDVLSRELSQAGFYGSLVPPSGSTWTAASACSTDETTWADSLMIHAFGWNSAPAASDADPSCLARKAGTDAIFVQRASTCAVGEANCEAENANYAYIQVSECGTEYSALATPYVVARGTSASFTLQSNACNGTLAAKRKLIRRIYYISTDNKLNYMDVQASGAQTPVTLVENVEQMQIEYAVATATSSGTAQSFTSTPTSADWPNVVGARIWILARSTDASTTAGAATSFEMGDYTGTNAVAFSAAATNPKRRVYSTYVPFTTPKSAKEAF